MLQTSLRTADGDRRFKAPHATIMSLIHRLQEIGSNWNHPRYGLPPGTTPSKDWHIRLKHLWDQWRLSTRTVAETPGRHNARIPTQTIHNHLRRFTLRARRPYRDRNGVLQDSLFPPPPVTTPFLSQFASHRTSLDMPEWVGNMADSGRLQHVYKVSIIGDFTKYGQPVHRPNPTRGVGIVHFQLWGWRYPSCAQTVPSFSAWLYFPNTMKKLINPRDSYMHHWPGPPLTLVMV